MSAGRNGLYEFKRKTTGPVPCDSCSKEYVLEDFWWCNECEEAVCSSCFMKKHNGHKNSNCDEGSIIREYVEAFLSVSRKSATCETLVDKFCIDLAVELKMRIGFDEDTKNIANKLETFLGTNNKSIDIVDLQMSGNKKFKFAETILKSGQNNLPMSPKMENFTRAFEMTPKCRSFKLPNVKEVANLFFQDTPSENSHETVNKENDQKSPETKNKENEKREFTIPITVVGRSQTSPRIENRGPSSKAFYNPTISVVEKTDQGDNYLYQYYSVATKSLNGISPRRERGETEVKWCKEIKSHRSCYAICTAPNWGVFLANGTGLISYTLELEQVSNKNWPCLPQAGYFKPSMAYHRQRNSLFVSRRQSVDNSEVLLEYSPQLELTNQEPLPKFRYNSYGSELDDTTHKRLVGVLNNGNIICANTANSTIGRIFLSKHFGKLWNIVYEDEKYNDEWQELFVDQTQADKNGFVIVGAQNIYTFIFDSMGKCRLVGMKPKNFFPPDAPVVVIEGVLYYLDSDKMLLRPAENKNSDRSPINVAHTEKLEKSRKFAEHDNGEKYMLACSENRLFMVTMNRQGTSSVLSVSLLNVAGSESSRAE